MTQALIPGMLSTLQNHRVLLPIWEIPFSLEFAWFFFNSRLLFQCMFIIHVIHHIIKVQTIQNIIVALLYHSFSNPIFKKELSGGSWYLAFHTNEHTLPLACTSTCASTTPYCFVICFPSSLYYYNFFLHINLQINVIHFEGFMIFRFMYKLQSI